MPENSIPLSSSLNVEKNGGKTFHSYRDANENEGAAVDYFRNLQLLDRESHTPARKIASNERFKVVKGRSIRNSLPQGKYIRRCIDQTVKREEI